MTKERERRLDFIPLKSAIDLEETAEVDQKTYDALK